MHGCKALATELEMVDFQVVPPLVRDAVADIYYSFGSSLLCELGWQILRTRELRGQLYAKSMTFTLFD